MAAPTAPQNDRLDRLEKQIAELRRRLEAIEEHLATRTESPSNRTAVREKVVFDWQS